MKILSDHSKGVLLTVSSGLFYGPIGYLGASLLKFGMSVPNMLFWRFLISSIILLIILLPKKKLLFQYPKHSFKIMLYGMFFYSASAIFYFISSKFIGTGLAMIMYFFYPAIVLIYNAIFYKTSIPPIYYKMFLVMLVGMVLLVDLSDLKVHLIGITIGFLASVGYALYVIHSKNTPLAPIVSSFMVSLGCMFTCFGFAIIDSSFIIPGQSSEWGYLVALSLICTSIPILLLLQGLKYISSAKASLLSVLEPVTVIILGVTLLGETIIFSQLIGIILVLFSASVIAVNRSSSE